MGEELIGEISHYYSGISVGIIDLTGDLSVGNFIHIVSANTDFEQEVESMQVDRKEIETARTGQSVGVKTEAKVKEGDKVFKILK